MPKPDKNQIPQPRYPLDYRWDETFSNLAVEVGPIRAMWPNEKRFADGLFHMKMDMSFLQNDQGPIAEPLLDSDAEKVYAPSLLSYHELQPVGAVDPKTREESARVVERHTNILRSRIDAFGKAITEKQVDVARVNPEGASWLRLLAAKADLCARGYGLEASSDYVFQNISSQLASIHTPCGVEEDNPVKRDFSAIMDTLSDMPFLPAYEDAARMAYLGCDHTTALRAGTLTQSQDRLTRKLLLVQYDHLASHVLNSIQTISETMKNPFDETYYRWKSVMDNAPEHLGPYSRGPLRVPSNLEGRRIGLRQGWPVEDLELIGSLYTMDDTIRHPAVQNPQQPRPASIEALRSLLQAIETTQITGPEVRTRMLNLIEKTFDGRANEFTGCNQSMVVETMKARRAEKLQSFQFLSKEELDQAQAEYKSRSALEKTAGSDGSPNGYYEQILAGTDVLSRLNAMYQIMAPVNKNRKDYKEYTALRAGTLKMIDMISPLYGSKPPQGQEREQLMEQLAAGHRNLSRLAQTYVSKCSRWEPAFKKAVGQELQSYCDNIAKTAEATKAGIEVAKDRRAILAEKQERFKSMAQTYQSYLDNIWKPYQETMNTAVDENDHMAVSQRGARLEELNAKLTPLQNILKEAPLSKVQLGQLLHRTYPNDTTKVEKILGQVDALLAANGGTAIDNLIKQGKITVPTSNVKGEETYAALSDQEKNALHSKVIREMVQGKVFDLEIFNTVAKDFQKPAIIQRLLPAEDQRAMFGSMLSLNVANLREENAKDQTGLEIYRHLPEVLDYDQLSSLVEKLEADPILHTKQAKTFDPPMETKVVAETSEKLNPVETNVQKGEEPEIPTEKGNPEQDRVAYLSYVDEIMSPYLDLKTSQPPEPLQYLESAKRRNHILELEERLTPMQKTIRECGLGFDHVQQLLNQAFPQDRAKEIAGQILKETFGICSQAINNKVLDGQVKRSNTVKNTFLTWEQMNDSQKQSKAKMAIYDMVNKQRFDKDIYAQYASQEDKIRICMSHLPKAQSDELRAMFGKPDLVEALDSALAEAGTAMLGMVQEGKLKSLETIKDSTVSWTDMTEDQRQPFVNQALEAMTKKESFDKEIFDRHTTPDQKKELCNVFLSTEEISKNLMTSLEGMLSTDATPEQTKKVYHSLPDYLNDNQLHTLVQRLNNDPRVHGQSEQTYCPQADQKTVENLRKRIETDYADNPQRKDALLAALTGAEEILRVPTKEAKDAAEARERIGVSSSLGFKDFVREKARREAPGERDNITGAAVSCDGNNYLPNTNSENMQKLMQAHPLPERARNALVAMLRKMNEMKMLPDGAKDSIEEESNKCYGFHKIKAAKARYREALQKGDLEHLEDARANYDREYQNIEDLRKLAKEGFGSEYTNCQDLYVTRDAERFPWEQISNPQQAQINSVYLMYQQMHRFDLTPEDFVDGFPATLFKSWYQHHSEKCDRMGLEKKDFSGLLESLMTQSNYQELSKGANLAPHRCIRGIWIMPDEKELDREQMAPWGENVMEQISEMGNREILRFELLSARPKEADTLYSQMRREAIQNLLVVDDKDRDVKRMVGLPAYNQDLTVKPPFSLVEYIQNHDIDPAGLKNRLDTMLKVAEKIPTAPFKEEVLAESMEVFTRILTAKHDQRETEQYKELEKLTKGLLEQFPTQEEALASKKLSHELDIDPSEKEHLQKRASHLADYRTRMEQTLRRYETFMNPLDEINQALKNADAVQGKNLSAAGFDGLKAAVQSLSELSTSLMKPRPDGALPELSSQSRKDLENSYQLVINTAAAFSEAARDFEALAPIRRSVEKVSHLAAQDLNILTGPRGSEAVTLGDIYEKRSPTYDVSRLEGKPVAGSGQGMAYRIPLGNGKTLEGVFTPERTIPEQGDPMAELELRIATVSPDAARIIPILRKESKEYKKLEDMGSEELKSVQRPIQMSTLNFRDYDHRYDSLLREANIPEKEIQKITNQVFANAIDDYLTSRAQIKRQTRQIQVLGLQPGDPAELRSGAMSAMAEVLGLSSLVPQSKPVTLVRNGTAIHGVFTEPPKGSDCRNPKQDDLILKMDRNTPLTPKAVKELASIQVLDYLCGNGVRDHTGLTYQLKEDELGKPVLDGFQAIGNNLSFGADPKKQARSAGQTSLEDLLHMPKSLADRVMELQPSFLKTTLREFGLPESQLSAMENRLREVQQRIRSGVEFFRDRPITGTSQDCIHVVPDEDYDKLSADSLKLKLNAVNVAPSTARLTWYDREQLPARRDIRDDERKLSFLYEKAQEVEKGVWFGSTEFEAMKNALLEVGQKHRALVTPNQEEQKKHLHKPTQQELDQVRDAYEKLKTATDAYIQRKTNQRREKGSLDKKSEARLELANRIRQEIQPQLAHMKKLPQVLEAAPSQYKAITDLYIEKSQPQSQPVSSQNQSEKKANPNHLPKTFHTSIDDRLNQITSLLDAQSKERTMTRQQIHDVLLEAFGMTEYRFAAGSGEVKVDQNSARIARDLVNSSEKTKSINVCAAEMLEDMPEADFSAMHPNSYKQMRAAIRLTLSDKNKVSERLPELTKLLKNPDTIHQNLSKYVQKLDQGKKL